MCTERQKLILRGKVEGGGLTVVKLGIDLATTNWIEAEQRPWPAVTAFECFADEICSN